MKNLFNYALVVLIMLIVSPSKINASENEPILKKSQITTTVKFAEKFCSAKADNFFEGLSNEKNLKYSYYKYIGLNNEEIFSKEMYKLLINQIRKECPISNSEEIEIKEFITKNDIQK